MVVSRQEKQKFEAIYRYIASLRPAAWAVQDPIWGNEQKSSELDLVDRSKMSSWETEAGRFQV